MKAVYLLVMCLASSCTIVGQKPEEQVRNLLRLDLYDAASARFERVQKISASSPSGQEVICGYVNSKNRFGAYAGFRQFVAYPSTKIVMIDPNSVSGPEQREFNAARRKASALGCKFWL